MWIPLHNHSQYSLLDGTASVEDLARAGKAFGMPAVALTDQGNLYGAIEFYKACEQQGIRPILGCEFYLAPTSRKEKKKIPGMPHGFPLILLARDRKGYSHLCQLSSLAHLEGMYYTPRIDKEILSLYHEGLFCLSGPLQGKIAQHILLGQERELLEEIEWFQKLFGSRFYFEVQRHPMTQERIADDSMQKEGWLFQYYQNAIRDQEIVNTRQRELGQRMGIRCVATNDCHYIERGDWKAHEIAMNIQSGEACEIWERDSFGNPKARIANPKRKVYFSHEFYFKSPTQMQELFADFPEALETTQEIASQITLELDFKQKHYPCFTSPEGISKEEYLKALCEEGIARRYTPERVMRIEQKFKGKDPFTLIRARLASELDIIISKGMSDYLLIVHDFITWAKGKKIPVGPGRGSGVGSIILFLIGVTDIEPLAFHLFFERFINPERPSYPDIDVDICMERRGEVLDYVVQKYGRDKVAQIITFSTIKAKMAIKDVGRVLSIPLEKVNRIAKLVPEELNITLGQALEGSGDFKDVYESDPEVKEWIDLARLLEGSVRNTGIHAAGIVICAGPITDYIPICIAKESEIFVTQFSMKPVEAMGMLKFDLLGLKTLTSIQQTVESVRLNEGKEIDWVNLPLQDKEAFAQFNQGNSQGLFQIEAGGGMEDLAKQLHIERFEELIAVMALYRPGPMEMIPSFINRKHGREPLDIDHPLMKDVLEETYGVMVYQEQVMQIASLLANYSLGEGDVLRRAMGKKDREEMSNQREKFRRGAVAKGIQEGVALSIFDKMEKFASYGFNKSHAAAYGYLSYVTAYLKAHHPREWMAALLTCECADLAQVGKIIETCRALKIPVLPPDINVSGKTFVATSEGIRFSMEGIKGVGEGIVETIVDERKKAGPFSSLFDFFKRVKIGKKPVSCLIEAGCFDFTQISREELLSSVPAMQQVVTQQRKENERGILDLFSCAEDKSSALFSPSPVKPLSKQFLLRREKELLGLYLTGHPLDPFRPQMKSLSCISFEEFGALSDQALCRAACVLEEVEVKISSKTQRKFALVHLSDGSKRIEVPIWPELYAGKELLLVENRLLYALFQIEKKGEEVKLHCRWIDDLEKVDKAMLQACERAAAQTQTGPRMVKKVVVPPPAPFTLRLDADQLHLSKILSLKKLFRAFPGNTPVHLEFWTEHKKLGVVEIGAGWGITPSDEFKACLASLNIM